MRGKIPENTPVDSNVTMIAPMAKKAAVREKMDVLGLLSIFPFFGR